MSAAKEARMAPDDLPIGHKAEDSTKLPGTKPLMRKDGQSGIRAESEVRGGAEQPEALPVEQQKRRDRLNP
jgi:hypothetical protein